MRSRVQFPVLSTLSGASLKQATLLSIGIAVAFGVLLSRHAVMIALVIQIWKQIQAISPSGEINSM